MGVFHFFQIVEMVPNSAKLHIWIVVITIFLPLAGADPNILKQGALYVGHYGWLRKNILDFI